MDELERVVFWFETAFDVRYLPDAPERGDHVTHAGAIWKVASVERASNGMNVICTLPQGTRRHLRRVA